MSSKDSGAVPCLFPLRQSYEQVENANKKTVSQWEPSDFFLSYFSFVLTYVKTSSGTSARIGRSWISNIALRGRLFGGKKKKKKLFFRFVVLYLGMLSFSMRKRGVVIVMGLLSPFLLGCKSMELSITKQLNFKTMSKLNGTEVQDVENIQIEYFEVPDSPFMVIKEDRDGKTLYFGVLGKHRITPYFDNRFKAQEDVSQMTWSRIFNIMLLVCEQNYTMHMNNKNDN